MNTRWVILVALAVTAGAVALLAAPAPTPAPSGATARESAGLHIANGTRITNWNHRITDGGSYIWDLQPQGTVGSGTNNAYGGGMYLYINNNTFNQGTSAVVNQAGDEIELGTWNPDGRIRVSRRIKVYKDRPLARWLEIFENTTTADVQVQVQHFSNCNWNIGTILTDTGETSFGPKDSAFVSAVNVGMNPAPPSVCHILCSKKSKLRPTLQVQGNQLRSFWNITVPAGGTAILCQFESQNSSLDDQKKLMADFQVNKLLRDLPVSVRKKILNFNVAGGIDDIDLDRAEKFDSVSLSNGDQLHGKIGNASYEVEGVFDKLTLPAEQVIGAAAATGDPEVKRFLLKDGQVVCGRTNGQKLQIELLAGPALQVPFERIGQWGYSISAAKPDGDPAGGLRVMLRSGDRLAVDAASLKLTLKTLYGPIALDGAGLSRITMDNAGNGMHRVLFANRSSLAGMIEPASMSLPLKLGPKLDLQRNMISEIYFGEEAPQAPLARVALSNGDELFGQLADGKLTVKTDYGQSEVETRTIKSLTFSTGTRGRVALELWDGTSGLRGDLATTELAFQVKPGPLLKLPVDQVQSFVAPFALPPESMMKDVNQLIDKLRSDKWKDRQEASDQLVKIGPAAIQVLKPFLQDRDAEVRQRIGAIIDRLRPDSDKTAPAPSGP